MPPLLQAPPAVVKAGLPRPADHARPRSDGIDLLRGVAIVLVILLHLAIRVPLRRTDAARLLPGWLIDALCGNGAEAVLVFFVVSGFLIAGNAIDRWGGIGRPHPVAFYARRAARILPCMAALLAVLSLLDLLHVGDYAITRPGQSLAGALVSALTFHLNLYEAYTGYLPANWDVLWSLSIEEAFYLGFPLACLLAWRTPWPLIALLVPLALSMPIASGMYRNELLREKAYLPGMGAIATGVLAALIVRGRRPSGRTRRAAIVAGIAGLLAIIFAEDAIWPHLGAATMLLLTVGTGSLLAGLQDSRFHAPPVMGWLRAFGRLSYEVYLSHMFVLLTTISLFHRAGMPARLGYLLYPPALALSLALGWMVARCVSQPAERALRAWWLPGGR